MKHKPESWNSASSDSQRGVRRSLTRAGLQLGQLGGQFGQVVTGALSSIQGGADSRGAAQSRMRELLNHDRAMLSNRACGEALRVRDEDEDTNEAPVAPVKGGKSRSAAQSRMRELLNQDRALLALRREAPDADLFDEPAAAEVEVAAPVESHAPTPAQPPAQLPMHAAPAGVFHGAVATVARGSCTGVAASFDAPPPTAFANPEPTPSLAPAPAAPAPAVSRSPAVAKPVAASRPTRAPAAAAADGDDDEGDPIRTRGMAKLLAMQGYRDRALSIYDELIAAEPDNADLRAEADRLRS